MAEPGRTAPTQTMSTRRMEALSDGVFSIAMTLLVLEIAIPPGSQDLLHDFLHHWPAYLAYVVSFATIGGVWLAHNVITEFLTQAVPTLIRLNLILLMFVAFLPFPTRLLAEYLENVNQERVAATIYGTTLFATNILVAVLWRYAASRQLIGTAGDDPDIKLFSRRLTPALGGYVVLIVVGLFFPLIAVFGYLLVAVNLLIPIRRHR
jgi:uncharacterized membrane protein